jgi:hypothetical protein
MFRFTIRELVLLTLVVAMGVGWALDHLRLIESCRVSDRNQAVLEAQVAAMEAMAEAAVASNADQTPSPPP